MRLLAFLLLLTSCGGAQVKTANYCHSCQKEEIEFRACVEYMKACKAVEHHRREHEPWFPVTKGCAINFE